MIILIIYMAAGYWATGQTIFRNKILIEFQFGGIFFQRVLWGTLLGWALIPVAIVRSIRDR